MSCFPSAPAMVPSAFHAALEQDTAERARAAAAMQMEGFIAVDYSNCAAMESAICCISSAGRVSFSPQKFMSAPVFMGTRCT